MTTQSTTPIVPSVGRKVWYYVDSLQTEPWDATVIKVHGTALGAPAADSLVNLLVINPDSGGSIFRPCIQHHSDDEEFDGERFAWMPYQTAQAAKDAATDAAPLPDESPAQQDAENTQAPQETGAGTADDAGQAVAETQTADNAAG